MQPLCGWGYCASPFAGSVSYADVLVAACGDSLLLLTSTGELIESTDLSYDLPEAISAIGVAGERLLLQAGPAVYLADLDNMDFQLEDPVPQAVSWVQPGQPGRDYQEQLEALSYGGGVTWERALLDLHSGKYFGRAGILLADLFALGMILLAVSGVWVWSTRPGRFTR